MEPQKETYTCKCCNALWDFYPDTETWNLISEKAGECCDNQPMKEQIVPLKYNFPTSGKFTEDLWLINEYPFAKNKDRGQIKILIGPTRSGKSTFVNSWMKIPHELPKVVVNTDTIRLALHGKRYCSAAEPMVFAVKHLMIKSLYLQKYFICVDGTHSTDVSIKRILEVDPTAEFMVFNTPAEECKKRAEATGQLDLIEGKVIDRHCRQLQKLLDEGLENVRARLLRDIQERKGIF